jgi:hypothetical protein
MHMQGRTYTLDHPCPLSGREEHIPEAKRGKGNAKSEEGTQPQKGEDETRMEDTNSQLI